MRIQREGEADGQTVSQAAGPQEGEGAAKVHPDWDAQDDSPAEDGEHAGRDPAVEVPREIGLTPRRK